MGKNKKKTKTSNKSLTRRASDVAVATKAMVVYSEPREEYGYDCNSEYRTEGETPLLTNGDNQSYGLYIKRKEEKTKTKVHFNPGAIFSGLGLPIFMMLIGGVVMLVPSFLKDVMGEVPKIPGMSESATSSMMEMMSIIPVILGGVMCLTSIFKIAQKLMRGETGGEEIFWTEKVKAKPKEKLEQFKVKMPNELSQDLLEESAKQ